MGSPFEATLSYRAMHSAVWVASDILLALGAQSAAALYQPLRLPHASFDSLAVICPLIIYVATAAHFGWSPLSLVVIFLLMRRAACCNSFPCCCSAALLSMSAQVRTEINWLHGWACVGGATTLRWSSSKRVVSLSRGPQGSLIGNFAIHLR
jgi:hypothetical protein